MNFLHLKRSLLAAVFLPCLGIAFGGQANANPSPQPQDINMTIKTLTPLQRQVTQQQGTEPAFDNAYWNNHAEGIYVDIVSGEALFSSTDKFDSGTGWPSFTKPLEASHIAETKGHGVRDDTNRGAFERRKIASRSCFRRWTQR